MGGREIMGISDRGIRGRGTKWMGGQNNQGNGGQNNQGEVNNWGLDTTEIRTMGEGGVVGTKMVDAEGGGGPTGKGDTILILGFINFST